MYDNKSSNQLSAECCNHLTELILVFGVCPFSVKRLLRIGFNQTENDLLQVSQVQLASMQPRTSPPKFL